MTVATLPRLRSFREIAAGAAMPASPRSSTFRARHGGLCSDCGCRIYPRALITATGSGYRHAFCPSGPA
jgi:hypothetical protein